MAWTFVRPSEAGALTGRPLLDIGIGDGQTHRALVEPTGLIVGIDRSPTVLVPARRVSGARLTAGDASALPFAAEVFGVALAGDLLHHLDSDALGTVLREVRRVLRTSGVLVAWWYERPGRPAPDAPRFPRPYEEVQKAAEKVGFSARVLALTASLEAGPPTAGIIATKLGPGAA